MVVASASVAKSPRSMMGCRNFAASCPMQAVPTPMVLHAPARARVTHAGRVFSVLHAHAASRHAA
jgi:hypothetical protein